MHNIYLKQATREDIDDLIEIDLTALGSLFYKLYTTLTDWQSAFDKGDIYFIMYEDNPVGNIYFYKKSDELVHLDGFLLKPEYRNLGIGTEALKLIIEIAISEGYSEMELVTHPDNRIAQSVYEHNGFSRGQILENYHGDGEPRAYFLNNNLGNS